MKIKFKIYHLKVKKILSDIYNHIFKLRDEKNKSVYNSKSIRIKHNNFHLQMKMNTTRLHFTMIDCHVLDIFFSKTHAEFKLSLLSVLMFKIIISFVINKTK